MREARLFHPDHFLYRCFSKVRPEAAPMDDREKERLASMLKLGAEIFQIKLMAYCVYDDSFDTLIRVPAEIHRPEREWLIERLLAFHRKKFHDRLTDGASGKIAGHTWDHELNKWAAIAGNPSEYFKAVKQNFSLWRNERRNTKGGIWKCRFSMIPVEDDPDVLLALVTEVGASPLLPGSPLNPGHPFCSFFELVENHGLWRKNLTNETGLVSWRQLSASIQKQAKSLRFAAFKRMPKQYGRVDLENLKKVNRKRIDAMASKSQTQQQSRLAQRYGRLTKGHPREKHDAILAEKDPELLKWVRKQRTRYRAGRMGKTLEGLLNKKQFQWTPTWTRSTQTQHDSRARSWSQRFREVKEFLRRNGRMPKRSEPGEYTLSRWITTQRHYRNKGWLDKYRLSKLDEMEKTKDVG